MESKAAKPCTFPGHTGLVAAWCQTCHRFVCIQGMVSKLHSGHVFISLEEIAKDHEAVILKKKEELRKTKESMDALLSHQLEVETQFNADVEGINDAIDRRSQSFLSEIESWKTKTKSLLMKKAEENKNCMKERQNQIKEDQNKLQAALDGWSQENYEDYLVMADKLIQAETKSSVYSPTVLSLTDGHPLKLDTDTVLGTIYDEDLHGSDCVSVLGPNSSTDSNEDIQIRPPAPIPDLSSDKACTDNTVDNSTSGNTSDRFEERIYYAVTPDDVEIVNHSLFQCNDQKGQEVKLAAARGQEGVWVTWTGKRCLKLFDDKGICVKQILTDFDVSDIGVNSKGELFASVDNGSGIKKKTLISWKTIIRTKPLVTYGIDITSTDEILVCLQAIDHGEIGRYSPTGENMQRIRLDQDFKDIFLRPRQLVTVDATGEVLVIVDGTLITLNEDGKIKKKWRGDLDSDIDNQGATSFLPVSLAATSDADLFVLDNGNRRIVVFDKVWEVTGVMTDTVMLQNMSSAVFDNKGQFWVAGTDGAIHKANLRFDCETKTD